MMFNASKRLDKDQNLWLRDDSSLSSASSDDNNLNSKRYRHGHKQTLAELANEARIANETRLANEARIASANPSFGLTEYHHHEERSLVNSMKTGDGLETDRFLFRLTSTVRESHK